MKDDVNDLEVDNGLAKNEQTPIAFPKLKISDIPCLFIKVF